MAISEYLKKLRCKIGTDLLLLPSVTGAVWNANRQLLLVRHREDGPWTLPGGIIDLGESPAQALVREVWEEAGLRVRPESIIGVFGGSDGFRRTYPNGDQVEFIDIVFACRVLGGSLECRDGETVEARYFDQGEIARLDVRFPIAISALIEPQAKTAFTWNDRWAGSDLNDARQ